MAAASAAATLPQLSNEAQLKIMNLVKAGMPLDEALAKAQEMENFEREERERAVCRGEKGNGTETEDVTLCIRISKARKREAHSLNESERGHESERRAGLRRREGKRRQQGKRRGVREAKRIRDARKQREVDTG